MLKWDLLIYFKGRVTAEKRQRKTDLPPATHSPNGYSNQDLARVMSGTRNPILVSSPWVTENKALRSFSLHFQVRQ